MNSSLKKSIKYKLLTKDELIISLDRLSRFKEPDESYNRVFNLILYKCLIQPKFSKKDLTTLPTDDLVKYVEIIWNESIKKLFPNEKNNKETNNALKLLATIPFKIDKNTNKLLNAKLDISQLLDSIDYDTAPLNLKFLILANKNFNSKHQISVNAIDDFRKKYKTKYPIKKLIIVEGITEETLLPVFADKLNYNLDENGIYILGAGGKSKSPSLYLELKEKLNIPVTLLFDSDAKEICDILNKNLLKKDKTILIEQGEFEDILSLNLIKRTINKEHETLSPIKISDLHIHHKMCQNIEEFYRTRKIGEFKKAKFSKMIANNIKYDTDITQDIVNIIEKLAK